MELSKKKKTIFIKAFTIILFLLVLAMQSNFCFAEAIGTAEVQTATDNIKRVITSIAMPLRRCINFC